MLLSKHQNNKTTFTLTQTVNYKFDDFEIDN